MKLEYKTIMYGGTIPFLPSKDGIKERVPLNISTPCCEDMKEALEEHLIGFGEFMDSYLNKETTLCIAKYQWGYDFYSIYYCPFCGEKIESEETERVTLKIVKKKKLQPKSAWTEVEIEVPIIDKEK